MSKNPRTIPSAEVRKVIVVTFLRGDGVKDDPVRQITAYYDLDGTLLAENDPTTEPLDRRMLHRPGRWTVVTDGSEAT
jgi:hypothetical protein